MPFATFLEPYSPSHSLLTATKQISQLEPNIVGYSALYSPNTGIADYGLVSHCIAHEIIETK
jgi:L-2-hydroxyglutarate oxidase LhgO